MRTTTRTAAAIAAACVALAPAAAHATPRSPLDLDAQTLIDRTVEFFTLKYDFLAWTIIGSILVGLLCGILGAFLVLRRLALMGDALGHATLPGVAIAFLLVGHKSLPALTAGATLTALAAAAAITFITRASRTRPDAALGIVLAAFFGLGAVLFSAIQNLPESANAGLGNILLGNAAAITPAEVGLLASLLALAVAGIGLFYRPLLLATFDPASATLLGVPTRALQYGLTLTTALAIVASVQSVGVVLVAGMIIIPASAARLLARHLHTTLLLAAAIGATGGLLGAFISFLLPGFSSGPSMVLTTAFLYALTLLLAPRRGLIARARHRLQQQRATTEAPAPPTPEAEAAAPQHPHAEEPSPEAAFDRRAQEPT